MLPIHLYIIPTKFHTSLASTTPNCSLLLPPNRIHFSNNTNNNSKTSDSTTYRFQIVTVDAVVRLNIIFRIRFHFYIYIFYHNSFKYIILSVLLTFSLTLLLFVSRSLSFSVCLSVTFTLCSSLCLSIYRPIAIHQNEFSVEMIHIVNDSAPFLHPCLQNI